MVKAVHIEDNSGSTSFSIISCLGPEIFVQINHMLTKFLPLKVRGSGNYDTPSAAIITSTQLHSFYISLISSEIFYDIISIGNTSILGAGGDSSILSNRFLLMCPGRLNFCIQRLIDTLTELL